MKILYFVFEKKTNILFEAVNMVWSLKTFEIFYQLYFPKFISIVVYCKVIILSNYKFLFVYPAPIFERRSLAFDSVYLYNRFRG